MKALKNEATFKLILKKFVPILLCAICIIGFLIFPNLDISVTSHFYDGRFYWNENSIVRFIYLVFAKIHFGFLLVLIIGLVYFSIKKLEKQTRTTIFLLVTLILGPGIFVNVILKDNSVGRPRPVHIQEFGGNELFTPVFHYSGVCKKNCSFVSGHAGIGFYFMSLYWVFRKRRWLAFGIFVGATVGVVRIVQGGHFLSDVIFAGWVVYFTCVLTNRSLKFWHRN